MAKKTSSNKGAKGTKGKKAANESDSVEPSRIELVVAPTRTQAQTGRIGLGLILAIPVGWSPLDDAFAGRGPYEVSMAKFLLVVAACVTGTTVIGRILDLASNNPTPTPHDQNGSSDNTLEGTGSPDSLSFSAPDR